jgi:hypothetical protein
VHILPSSIDLRATSVKWNLEPGVNLRLVDQETFDFDSRDAGNGLVMSDSGEIFSLDLSEQTYHHLNDAFSAFTWWTFNQEFGYVEGFLVLAWIRTTVRDFTYRIGNPARRLT